MILFPILALRLVRTKKDTTQYWTVVSMARIKINIRDQFSEQTQTEGALHCTQAYFPSLSLPIQIHVSSICPWVSWHSGASPAATFSQKSPPTQTAAGCEPVWEECGIQLSTSHQRRANRGGVQKRSDSPQSKHTGKVSKSQRGERPRWLVPRRSLGSRRHFFTSLSPSIPSLPPPSLKGCYVVNNTAAFIHWRPHCVLWMGGIMRGRHKYKTRKNSCCTLFLRLSRLLFAAHCSFYMYRLWGS